MIDEKELERVCRLAGLMKITTAKVPTYRTKAGDAAVELTNDGLKGFWFIEGERNYEKIMDDGKICSVLQAFEAESSRYEPILDPKTQEKVGERLKDAGIGILEDKVAIPATAGAVSIVNTLPDTFTGKRIIIPQDFQDLEKMRTIDRILLFQKTPKHLIESRRGFLKPSSVGKAKKDLTDDDYKMFSYVEGIVMEMEANFAFLYRWSSEVTHTQYFPDQVVVSGYVEVEFDDGKKYRKPCGGAGKKKETELLDWGDALKTAITEMEKNGFRKLGFNGDVYRGEV